MKRDKKNTNVLLNYNVNPEVITTMKKGFSIPFDVYGIDKELEGLKTPIDIPDDKESKFAAYVLSDYCHSRNLDVLRTESSN